jgi:hypothetical protein
MCRFWVDYIFEGTSRQRLVNQMLGNLFVSTTRVCSQPAICYTCRTEMILGCSSLLGNTTGLLRMETTRLLREQCHTTSE